MPPNIDRANASIEGGRPPRGRQRVPAWTLVVAGLLGIVLGYIAHEQLTANTDERVYGSDLDPIARWWYDGASTPWDDASGIFIAQCHDETTAIDVAVHGLAQGRYWWALTDGDAPNPDHVGAEVEGVRITRRTGLDAGDGSVSPILQGDGRTLLEARFEFTQAPPDDQQTPYLYVDTPLPKSEPPGLPTGGGWAGTRHRLRCIDPWGDRDTHPLVPDGRHSDGATRRHCFAAAR